MKSHIAFFALPASVAFTMLLASACNSTAFLGTDKGKFSNGGSTFTGSSSSGMGGAGGSTSSGFIVPDSGLPDSPFGQCVPATCATLNVECGPQGDGCGNQIDCGNCKSPAICGGGGKPSICSAGACQPKTCADWSANCGPVSDGCGNLIQCGTCTAPETCGGGSDGGTPSQCGGNMACVPTTCAAANVNCGPIGDGCGGLVQCGSCITPQTCGGGGVPGQCGSGSADAGDAGNNCVPATSCPAGINCGPAGDGCGGQLDCGTCTGTQTCGGGGQPGVCGGNNGCVKLTCAGIGHTCGPAGDGCGGTIQCGTCVAPQTCGGGATPGQCGGFNACVAKTCAQLGYNCGPAGDGCGGLLQCGTCTASGEICGGGGMPGVCGPAPGTNPNCQGLCLKQQACPATGATTTITGTVYAPNGTDPLYNALVYVPNGGAAPTYGVTPFSAGVHCGACGSEVSGTPLVSTNSAPDGTFQLTNVPVGNNIPLVIQLGRWRRKITIPTVTACTNNALGAAYTALPSNEPGSTGYPPAWYPAGGGDPADNIPLIAFSTGSVDGLECVLLKVGIAANQFSNPATQGGTGRVRLYKGEGNGGLAGGAVISAATTPSAAQLYGSQAEIDQYDMVFFPCQGAAYTKTAAQQQVVVNYTSAGGRIFGTHYSYVWFINPTPAGAACVTSATCTAPEVCAGGVCSNPFNTTANWAAGTGSIGDQTGYINTGFARGQALAQWLQITGSSTTYAQMPINTLRTDFTNVVAPSLLWVTIGGPVSNFTWPMHYTFDTPVGSPAASQCGRALFDDFHVENANNNNNIAFPLECPAGAMTPQEKMLEFMIFDLSSCIITTPPTNPTCTPVTCASQGFNCGPAGDGCGNQLDCGTCMVKGQTCGGGGQAGVCGGTACVPQTCAAQGIQCGPAGDGCGNLIECPVCQNGLTCGGGGPGKCGKVTCNPITCAAQKIQCGPAGNGCGGLINCGNCPSGQTCGGGGPGKCGAPDASACPPLTCAEQNIECGPAGNGCGGQLDCGACVAPQTCGGGGQPGVCGVAVCTPTTCAALKIECGPAGDGCGGTLQCGTCSGNLVCGACGAPGMCNSCCTPTTCKALGFNCGPAGDGCGGLLDCGTCTAPDTCGGAGKSGVCGHTSTN